MPPYEYPSPARSSPGDDKPSFDDTPYVNYPPEAMTPQMKRHNERIKQREQAPEQPSANVPMPPVRHVQPITIVHPATVVMPEVRRFEDPRQRSKPPVDSKKEFEKPRESKKDFEPVPISKKKFEPEPEIEDDAPVFDRDGDEGRWRTDDQVKELVIYRWEFKRWPDDVEDKSSKDTRTGLESYYELRYFKEGTNRKGERYSELYGKHRAKRDLWIEEESQRRAISTQLDASEAQSNVVRFAARRANSAG